MRCLGSSFFAAYRIRHGECVWKAGESRLQVGCELWLCQFYTFYFNWMITKLVTCSRLLAHSSRFGRHWRHRLRRRRCNLNASPHQVDWGIDTPTDRQTNKVLYWRRRKKKSITYDIYMRGLLGHPTWCTSANVSLWVCALLGWRLGESVAWSLFTFYNSCAREEFIWQIRTKCKKLFEAHSFTNHHQQHIVARQ